MFNNYITTIPQVADTLRTLGYSQPKPVRVGRLPVDDVNPANKDYRDQWRQEAIDNAYNSIRATKSSKAMMLLEPSYPKKSNNRSQAPFQSSYGSANDKVDWNTAIYSGYSGAGNITSAAALSDADFEIYRKKLLDARLKDFSAQPDFVPTPAPPIPQQNMFMQNKQMVDVLLNSVSDRINSGIADNSVYNDLLKVTQFYNANIWQVNNTQVLNNLLVDLDDIVEAAEGNIKTAEDKLLEPSVQRNLNSGDSILTLLYRLIEYIKANIGFVSRSENERKINARVTSFILSKYMRVDKKTKNDVEREQFERFLNVDQAPEEEDEETNINDELPPALAPQPVRPAQQFFSRMNKQEKLASLFSRGIEAYLVDKTGTLKRLNEGRPLSTGALLLRQLRPEKYTGSGKKSRKVRGGKSPEEMAEMYRKKDMLLNHMANQEYARDQQSCNSQYPKNDKMFEECMSNKKESNQRFKNSLSGSVGYGKVKGGYKLKPKTADEYAYDLLSNFGVTGMKYKGGYISNATLSTLNSQIHGKSKEEIKEVIALLSQHYPFHDDTHQLYLELLEKQPQETQIKSVKSALKAHIDYIIKRAKQSKISQEGLI